MASARITREEAERGLLPPVCALTGVPTDDVKAKTFAWLPGWVYVFILPGLIWFILFALIFRKTQAVELPLVREKHRHWAWRQWVGLGGIFQGVALVVGGAVVGSNRNLETVGTVLWVAGLVCFLGFLIVALILQSTCIRTTEITDRDIRLVGLHPEFVRALKADRERDRAEWEQEGEEERARRATDPTYRPAPKGDGGLPRYGDY